MNDLASKNCLACEAGTSPLTREEAGKLLTQVSGWELVDPTSSVRLRSGLRWVSGAGLKIRKRFKFGTYLEGIDFVDRIAKLAESEDHHPDMFVGYARVTVNLTTHAIGGLSENDFILAAKIDALTQEQDGRK